MLCARRGAMHRGRWSSTWRLSGRPGRRWYSACVYHDDRHVNKPLTTRRRHRPAVFPPGGRLDGT